MYLVTTNKYDYVNHLFLLTLRMYPVLSLLPPTHAPICISHAKAEVIVPEKDEFLLIPIHINYEIKIKIKIKLKFINYCMYGYYCTLWLQTTKAQRSKFKNPKQEILRNTYHLKEDITNYYWADHNPSNCTLSKNI